MSSTDCFSLTVRLSAFRKRSWVAGMPGLCVSRRASRPSRSHEQGRLTAREVTVPSEAAQFTEVSTWAVRITQNCGKPYFCRILGNPGMTYSPSLLLIPRGQGESSNHKMGSCCFLLLIFINLLLCEFFGPLCWPIKSFVQFN